MIVNWFYSTRSPCDIPWETLKQFYIKQQRLITIFIMIRRWNSCLVSMLLHTAHLGRLGIAEESLDEEGSVRDGTRLGPGEKTRSWRCHLLHLWNGLAELNYASDFFQSWQPKFFFFLIIIFKICFCVSGDRLTNAQDQRLFSTKCWWHLGQLLIFIIKLTDGF